MKSNFFFKKLIDSTNFLCSQKLAVTKKVFCKEELINVINNNVFPFFHCMLLNYTDAPQFPVSEYRVTVPADRIRSKNPILQVIIF